MFWRRALEGFKAPTPLGIDRAGRLPSPREPAHDHRELRLSREETALLQADARKHRLTLSTLLQGAWALLLSGYSGEDEVVFGVTVSGRPANLPDAERM